MSRSSRGFAEAGAGYVVVDVLVDGVPGLPEVRGCLWLAGSSDAWWLRERFDGVVDALPARPGSGSVADGSGVKLLLDGPTLSDVTTDHELLEVRRPYQSDAVTDL